MVKTGVYSARVYELGQAHLLDPAEALKPGMVNDLHDLRLRETKEAINGIINDLYFDAHAGANIGYPVENFG